MKHLSIILGLIFVFAVSNAAFARPKYSKETGIKCTQCHEEGKPKKEPNPDNKLWAKGKEMSDTMKNANDPEYKGEKSKDFADYVGKTACMDCHKGKAKPDKEGKEGKEDEKKEDKKEEKKEGEKKE